MEQGPQSGGDPTWPMSETEQELRATAAEDLPGLAVADQVTRLLAYVLEHAGVEASATDPAPPTYWRAKAMLYLGTLALRIARATLALIAMGYGPEALVFKRTLVELHSRAQKVVADESGQYAAQWLEGKAGKPSKAVSPFTPRDLWASLSFSAHADHRQVEHFLTYMHDDGSTSMKALPERMQDRDDATLSVVASELRDIAMLIAKVHDARLDGIERIDDAIRSLAFWQGAEDDDLS